MSVLSYKQKKYIERKIRSYFTLKDDVEEWRQGIISGPKREEKTRRQPQRASDPTGITGIKLATPPPYIQNKLLWIESIDIAYKNLQGTKKERLFEVLYFSGMPPTLYKVAKEFEVSKKQLHIYINEIVIYVALIAAQKGVFTIEEKEEGKNKNELEV